MTRLFTLLLVLTVLGACATTPTHKLDSRLSLPFSERTDIIHAYEAVNFVPVDKGEKDIMLFYKSMPAATLAQYRTFDTYVISQSNVVYHSINNRRAASRMRKYIRAKLKQYKFKHTGKSLSQAGIAVMISSYQKILGKNIEELMLVVYDRRKARQLARDNQDLKGYRLLKEVAVWVGVVRRKPETQMDISQGVHNMSTAGFQQMLDLMFENFMQDSQIIPLSLNLD